MQKWEYLTVTMEKGSMAIFGTGSGLTETHWDRSRGWSRFQDDAWQKAGFTEVLNELGLDGWELVTVAPMVKPLSRNGATTTSNTFFLKRRLE